MDVTLETYCLLALIVSPFASGKPRAICPNPTIQAVEGDTVTLQCHLNPPHNVVDYALDWTRDDLNKGVYSYRGKQENPNDWMDQYKGRSTLHLEDLSRGILTLQISSVQLADSGPYKCFISRLRTSCVVNVTVETKGKDQQNETKRNESSTTGPPDDHNAAEMEAVWKTLIPILVVAAAGGSVLFILVKRGKIKICKKTLREAMRPEAEMKPNNFEMENLRTGATERDED
ncbi:butyrophilin subfamily 2 member A2-like isoform X2 [Micropterus salmoides]|uniref:butyrophilin subfamily 2 member A2-like isoform X2 n=1 Tax=Micropterus salmoides TaxID=27706 RepID=UPI0018EDF2E9|nr:butyrophilin subfamily 2 member A2-like isoform X2 [Micropterus salmoides]